MSRKCVYSEPTGQLRTVEKTQMGTAGILHSAQEGDSGIEARSKRAALRFYWEDTCTEFRSRAAIKEILKNTITKELPRARAAFRSSTLKTYYSRLRSNV
ncbi:hypothetical protein [Phaffia rhodozyma]|uniref:Uncharacterized protein n=1 Tax=Phaffia rhodozyma TaxID=264483 RepID=A0A0F7SGU2_PHARH|nr:hypothetical protein [Phaffia rhodozyma]